MALVTTTTGTVAGAGFTNIRYGTDLTGCEELVAAVSAAQIVIEQLAVWHSSSESAVISIGEGETNSGCTTVLLPIPTYGESDGFSEIHLTRPLMLSTSLSCTVDTDVACKVTVLASGYWK